MKNIFFFIYLLYYFEIRSIDMQHLDHLFEYDEQSIFQLSTYIKTIFILIFINIYCQCLIKRYFQLISEKNILFYLIIA